MRGRARVLTAVVVLALAATACGGDDDAADSAGDDGDASVTTFPSSVGDLPGVSSECEAFANLSLALTSILSGGFEEVPEGIVGNLPSGAQADGQVVVDALDEFGERMAAAGIDLSEGLTNLDQSQLETYAEISGEVFDDEVEEAFDNLSEAVADECALGS